MIAGTVYVLCAATSAWCALLLLRQFVRSRSKLLFWSGISFVGFAVANAFVFADFVVLPDIDLSLVRSMVAFLSIAVLLYGLIWEAD